MRAVIAALAAILPLALLVVQGPFTLPINHLSDKHVTDNPVEVIKQRSLSLPLAPIVAFAQQGGGGWSLNLNDVGVVQTYVLPSPPPPGTTLDNLYRTIQDRLYHVTDPERHEILVVADGVVGNKTIVVSRAFRENGYLAYTAKVGYFVKLDGTVHAWTWRKFYNDSDLVFMFSFDSGVNRVINRFNVTPSMVIGMIANAINQQYGTSNPTDDWDIAFSSSYYIPSRDWASQFSIYYSITVAPLYAIAVHYFTFQAYISSAEYSEALYTGWVMFRDGDDTTRIATITINNNQVWGVNNPPNTFWATWAIGLPLDTTNVIKVGHMTSRALHLLFLFR